MDNIVIDATGVFTDYTGNTISGIEEGSTYVVLQYPLGSHARDQVPAEMDIFVKITDTVTPNTPTTQDIQSRCSYSLGATPEDDVATDPIIFSNGGDFTNLELTPVVLLAGKELISEYGEDETATGPNFPFNYLLE